MISETPVISNPVQDLTGEEVLLTTQKSNGTVTIKLKQSYWWEDWWSDKEDVDVIIHDTTYTSTVQKDWNSCFVCVNVAQEVVDARSSFATVVKKSNNRRAVANLTWENGSASGEIEGLETGKGTKTLSLYYIYTNKLPNKSKLDYTGDKKEYGPSGNNVPFVKVDVDIDKLLAHYGEVGLDHITPVTCEAVAADATPEAKKSATENWWKWIVENCMDETAQTALKQTGIGNYYACYFINLNRNLNHGDGILTKEPPVYMVEMNYTEDDGQTQFLTGLVRGSDNKPNVNEVKSAFADAIDATGDIDWTNKIFKKNGTYYSFSVTTDPAVNAELSDSIEYNEKFGNYFVTTYSVASQRMTITHNPITIDVTKKDKDTHALLSGVKFQLYSDRDCTEQDGVTTKETVTTENGVASFTVTEPGQYYLKEITPLQGYKKLSDPVSIEVTVDEGNFSYSGNNGTYNLSVGPVTVENEKCNHSNIPEDSWSVVTQAGCTTKGTEKATTCPDCGMEVTREIPALGHKYNDNWIDSKDGNNHYKNCERDSTHERLTAEHKWDSGRVTKEATCTEPGEKTYTCTDCNATRKEPISALGFTYTINQHFINAKGEKTSKTGKALSANKDTALSELIKDLAKNQTIENDRDNYMYVSGKYTTKSKSKKDQPIESGSKLIEDTTIDLYYYLDNWKDADNTTDKDSETGGDDIPDCYQVLVKYQSGDTNRGSVGPLTMEVLTIKSNGVYASEGQVTATGSTAEATGRNYFSNWTNKDNTQVGSKATLEAQTIKNAKGGDVYTFTANFDRSSGGGGGGSNRPKPPVVEIPDDVPTGLNGKDHYAYIIGYGNNDVRPQNNITRAEVATIFFRLLTDETREANMTKSNGYNDVKDGDWFCCAVSTLSKMGIIKGYEDGSFKPNDPISRAEFAAIAARFDPDGDKTPATFADVTSHWAKDEISIAANHGWIKGYEDGSFKPDQKITRAETMTLVNRVLNRLPETKDDLHKDMKTWVDNMDETAWYYLAVQEATNSHYFKNKTGTKFEQWTDLRDTRDWSELEK